MRRRKRAVVLGALLATGLALVPVTGTVPSTTATAQMQVPVAEPLVAPPAADSHEPPCGTRDYRCGHRRGSRAGRHDARQDCSHSGPHHGDHRGRRNAYERGYTDGYDRAFSRYCHRGDHTR
jgi:hypothetical protein